MRCTRSWACKSICGFCNVGHRRRTDGRACADPHGSDHGGHVGPPVRQPARAPPAAMTAGPAHRPYPVAVKDDARIRRRQVDAEATGARAEEEDHHATVGGIERLDLACAIAPATAPSIRDLAVRAPERGEDTAGVGRARTAPAPGVLKTRWCRPDDSAQCHAA